MLRRGHGRAWQILLARHSNDMRFVIATSSTPSFLNLNMPKCMKPIRHIATSSTRSFKWSVLIGRAGRPSNESH